MAGQPLALLNDCRNAQFMDASDTPCNEVWRKWPSIQAHAILHDTFFLFEPFASVGNLFSTFSSILPVVRFLEMGLVLDLRKENPEFLQAFEASEIMWDTDPEPLRQQAQNIEQGNGKVGLHSALWRDGIMVISDAQLERLIWVLGINARTLSEVVSIITPPTSSPMLRTLFSQTRRSLLNRGYINVEPCAWNMFLKRSSLLVQSLEMNSPWLSEDGGPGSEQRPEKYVGWHIRTSHGESNTSWSPDVHTYIFQEPAEVVCPAFETATEAARIACPRAFADDMRIFISSTSKDMARSCIKDLSGKNIQGGQVDMGLGPGDSHTKYSQHPNATMNAFLDYIFLLEATVIVCSGSSFSGTVARMKGLRCKPVSNIEIANRVILVCTPKDASC